MGGLTFRKELAEAVMDGRKVVTRRIPSDNPLSPWWRERCGFQAGRHYAVQPGHDAEARREGCADLEDFKRVWAELHGEFDGSLKVWVLCLERRLRFRIHAPAGNTPIVNTFPAADAAELRHLLAEYPKAWAIDNRTGARVSRNEALAA